MKKNLIYIVFLFSFLAVKAQEEKKEEKDKSLPAGNVAFAEKNYVKAEADYRISQSKFPKKVISSYNLGNSIYTMKHSSEAKLAYANAIKNATTRPEKHKVFHNLGNSLMLEKNYQGAVQAYKSALINNPEDEQTRYNYALAKKKLEENPPPKDKKDKKDDKKDKDKKDKKEDKDKKDDKKDKDKKDDKGDEKKDQGGKKPDPKPQPKPGGISQQRMENLLDAVNHEEKKVQDKVKANQVKGKPVQTEKDW